MTEDKLVDFLERAAAFFKLESERAKCICPWFPDPMAPHIRLRGLYEHCPTHGQHPTERFDGEQIRGNLTGKP